MPLLEPSNKKVEEKKIETLKGSNALREAALSGDYEKVRQLCAKSTLIDCDEEGRTALHYAAAIGHIQIVKLLIENGANVNANDKFGYSCLHHACTEGHSEVVKFLLKNGSSIDHQDAVHSNTGLHEAAWKGYSQTIQELCKYKANLYLKNKSGNTALHLTCQQGHNQSCRNILINGCKPDVKNNYGDTPLHTATRYGHAGVVRILISAFCDVNDVNKNGDTALHISAAMGRRKLTKILLETRCDSSIKNKQGETCLDIALRKSFKEVQEIITAAPSLKIKESRKVKKEKEKESRNSSLASRTSKKSHKHKKGKSVSFPHNSPYGCPMSPEAEDFPKPKIDSLPSEPLKQGEQYFIDLAGNIRKGPVGKSFNCYCAPLINKVEKKMEMDKKEIKEHIDTCHDDLNEKIVSLEKKTSHQLTSLNETVKNQFNTERVECIERQQKCNLRQRLDFERRSKQQAEQFKSQMKSWIESELEHTQMNGLIYQTDLPRSLSQCVDSNKRSTDQLINHSHYDVLKSSHSLNFDEMCPAHCSVNALGFFAQRSKSETQLVENGHHCNANEIVVTKFENCTNGLKLECDQKVENVERYQFNDGESISEKSDQMKEECFQPNECNQNSRPKQINETFQNGGGEMEKKLEAITIQDNEPVADLMKTLRCNNPNIIEVNYRNSPFSDSGYRTKYSPSPRENGLSEQPMLYNPSNHFIKAHYFQPPSDPPIGLPIVANTMMNGINVMNRVNEVQPMNGLPYIRKTIQTLRLSNATPTSSLV